jgi:hypothetical protein
MRRNTLYLVLSGACIAGYIWLYFQDQISRQGKTFGVCMIKHVTDVPCPSCGSTRAVLALVDGDLTGSIMMNPFGILLAFIMVVCPLWLVIDIFSSGNSLWRTYNQIESFFRQRWVAIASVGLVMMNWIWNIYKDA